jgi:3',5'-cyclic AMP phosphodiesterase CpdA
MNPRRTTPSRRELMRWSAGALLAADLWPGRLFAAETDAAALEFIIVNDLHTIDAACGKWQEKVVASMKAQAAKPAFCMIAGDLVENGKASEFAIVNDVYKALGIPIYTVPGNHDYPPKTTDRKPYEAARPQSVNYTFEAGGWQFVALDSTDGTKATAAVLKPTLDYLDHALPKLDKSKPTILITHFPLGPGVKNRSTNADAVLDRFKAYNLSAVFGGHYHASTETAVRGIPIRTNRCCSLKRGNHDGSKEKGYFVCSAKDAKVSATFVEVAGA